MNWDLVLLTYGLLFLAELGDKTQLAVMSLSAQYGHPWSVFAGATLALASTSLIGALVGRFISNLVPAEYVRIIAGFLFIGIGIVVVVRSTLALSNPSGLA